MMNVKIDETTALSLLYKRVDFWTESNGPRAELFYKMYENYVNNGFFEGCEFDVKQIVDNDIVNYCSVVEENEKDFKKLLKFYKNGEYDVSCEHFEERKVSFIEAVSDDETMILIRH